MTFNSTCSDIAISSLFLAKWFDGVWSRWVILQYPIFVFVIWDTISSEIIYFFIFSIWNMIILNKDNWLKWTKIPQYCKTNLPTYLSLKNDPTQTKIPIQLSFQVIFLPTPIFLSAVSLPYPENPFVSSINLRERNHKRLFRLL